MVRCFAITLFLSLAAVAQVPGFKHVIIVVQENRTPDNLFQGLCAPPFGRPSSCAAIAGPGQYAIQRANWRDKSVPGGVTQPAAEALIQSYDLVNRNQAFKNQCDKNAAGKCRMDGSAQVDCVARDGFTCPAHPQFKYVDYLGGDLNPYLEMATQYGWANNMFQTNQGPSYPAHQYLFAGTSAPSDEDDAIGTFLAENGNSMGERNHGCIGAPNETVQLIDSRGTEAPGHTMFPCFDHVTLSDLLEKQGLSWTYYSPGVGVTWTAPDSFTHICNPSGGQCTGVEWQKVDLVPSDVLTDIQNCELPSVSWVVPIGPNSDHSGGPNGGGPAWVASIVNAVGDSSSTSGCDYWGANRPGNETAVIVLWDDWGGWYDHVAPTISAFPYSGYEQGFRVPLIAISAYTPVKLISNTRYDFGSVVRFVEQNFGIAEGALGYADQRSSSDLTDMFTMQSLPRPFVTITAPDFVHGCTECAPDDD